MNDIKLLIDIGSTFTKVVAVTMEEGSILAKAKSPTTVENDVTLGILKALESIDREIGGWKGKDILACSSAAGGLRMISIGLVPELSSEAAKRAALGAGAKIVGLYSFQLTRQEIEQIERISPDIILLAGGTDGGNERAILHNANVLARSSVSAPIIVAGNKCTYDEIERIFRSVSKKFTLVANAMPEIGRLEVDECREAIREVFMGNIVKAKGLSKAKDLVGDIIMPTPAAVLNAATLLAQGTEGEKGLGELIVVDVGGATTDIYSVAKGAPTKGAVVMRGLPEPFAKRTVEGDLGVRHNIDTLLKICGDKAITIDRQIVAEFQADTSKTPINKKEMAVDEQLARIAVETSFERHVGRVEIVYGPHGEMVVQTGKDLSRVTTVIGTGGPIIHAPHPADILNGVVAPSANGNLLKPERADFYVDEHYIMYAAGLLARSAPGVALRTMKKYLKPLTS